MNFDYWQKMNKLRSDAKFPGCNWWGPSEWALAACEETGEAAGIIKKANRRGCLCPGIIQHNKLTTEERAALKLEIGDAVTYLALLCESVDMTLEECARAAWTKVNARVGSTEELVNG